MRTFRIAIGLDLESSPYTAEEQRMRACSRLVSIVPLSAVQLHGATLIVDPVQDVIGALDALSRAGLNARSVRWLNVSRNT